MIRRWFTFGQNHAHSVNGKTFDKDVVVEIEAVDPRAIMVELFGHKWSKEYETLPDLRLFPKGVVTL